MTNSRNKGVDGELELAKRLRECGFDARRGQQFSGGADSPDVVSNDLAAFHIECKRVERTLLYEWLDQATRDAGPDKVPVVMHRRSRKPWVVILTLEDFLTLVRQTEIVSLLQPTE